MNQIYTFIKNLFYPKRPKRPKRPEDTFEFQLNKLYSTRSKYFYNDHLHRIYFNKDMYSGIVNEYSIEHDYSYFQCVAYSNYLNNRCIIIHPNKVYMCKRHNSTGKKNLYYLYTHVENTTNTYDKVPVVLTERNFLYVDLSAK